MSQNLREYECPSIGVRAGYSLINWQNGLGRKRGLAQHGHKMHILQFTWANAGRVHAEIHFSAERYCREIDELYSSLIQ
jgi:hypothetical protein